MAALKASCDKYCQRCSRDVAAGADCQCSLLAGFFPTNWKLFRPFFYLFEETLKSQRVCNADVSFEPVLLAFVSDRLSVYHGDLAGLFLNRLKLQSSPLIFCFVQSSCNISAASLILCIFYVMWKFTRQG